jgi:hypothetical protein
VKNFGYAKVDALVGDYVWYDANVNAQQDEWYDADGNGQITPNGTSYTIDEWEFADLNGNGIADLPGELNTCAIGGVALNAATGPDITIKGSDGQERTRPTGATGYYRYNSINVSSTSTQTVPLDPTQTYTASINPFDALLLEGGAFYQSIQGQAISCKPIPAGSPVTQSLPQGGAPIPLVINTYPDGSADSGVSAAGAVEGAPQCGVTTAFSQVADLGQTADGIYLDADFGTVCVAETATVGDHVWLDRNPNGATTPEQLAGDGLQNDPANEPGVEGIEVQLWGVGADGVIGTADDVPADTTTTGAGGIYAFTGVSAGKYYMVFVKQPGPRAWGSQPNVGSDREIDSDVIIDPNDPNRAVTGVINVAGGTIDYSWDAALVDTSGAASSDLGDFVWNDSNKNGIQETGEAGIPNIKVDLYFVGGTQPTTADAQAATLLATTTTNSSGLYFFRALDPGTYYVQFIVPAGYTVSPRNAGGNPALDSDADATGRTANIVLPNGVSDLTWDAGIYVTPTADAPSDEPQPRTFIFLPTVQQ